MRVALLLVIVLVCTLAVARGDDDNAAATNPVGASVSEASVAPSPTPGNREPIITRTIVDGDDSPPLTHAPPPPPAASMIKSTSSSTTSTVTSSGSGSGAAAAPTRSSIFALTGEQLRLKLLSRTSRAWVVKFFSGKDAVANAKLDEKFRKASLRAEPLQSGVRFAQIDCDVETVACDRYKIDSLPTILGVLPHKEPIEYTGPHMIRELVDFAAERIPQHFRNIRTLEDGEDFFKTRPPKIILFTDEEDFIPPEFRALAFEYSRSMDWAVIRTSREDVTERYLRNQVDKFPAYVVFSGVVVDGEASFNARLKGDGLVLRLWVEAVYQELQNYLAEHGGEYPPLDVVLNSNKKSQQDEDEEWD